MPPTPQPDGAPADGRGTTGRPGLDGEDRAVRAKHPPGTRATCAGTTTAPPRRAAGPWPAVRSAAVLLALLGAALRPVAAVGARRRRRGRAVLAVHLDVALRG